MNIPILIYDVRSSRDVKYTGSIDDTFGLSRWHTHAPVLPEDSLGSPLSVPEIMLAQNAETLRTTPLFVLLKRMETASANPRIQGFAKAMVGRIYTLGKYLEEAANGLNIQRFKIKIEEIPVLRKTWVDKVAPLLSDLEQTQLGYVHRGGFDPATGAKIRIFAQPPRRPREIQATPQDYIRLVQSVPYADLQELVTSIQRVQSIRGYGAGPGPGYAGNDEGKVEFLSSFFKESIPKTITRDREGIVLNTDLLRGTMGWGEDPNGHRTYRGVTTVDYVVGRTPSRVLGPVSGPFGTLPLGEDLQGRDPINDFGIIVDRWNPDPARYACCYQDMKSRGCWIDAYSTTNSGPTPYDWMGKKDPFVVMQGGADQATRLALLQAAFQTGVKWDHQKMIQRGSAWISQDKYDAIHAEIVKLVEEYAPSIVTLWIIAAGTDQMAANVFWRDNMTPAVANALVKIHMLQHQYNKPQNLADPAVTLSGSQKEWATLLCKRVFRLSFPQGGYVKNQPLPFDSGTEVVNPPAAPVPVAPVVVVPVVVVPPGGGGGGVTQADRNAFVDSLRLANAAIQDLDGITIGATSVQVESTLRGLIDERVSQIDERFRILATRFPKIYGARGEEVTDAASVRNRAYEILEQLKLATDNLAKADAFRVTYALLAGNMITLEGLESTNPLLVEIETKKNALDALRDVIRDDRVDLIRLLKETLLFKTDPTALQALFTVDRNARSADIDQFAPNNASNEAYSQVLVVALAAARTAAAAAAAGGGGGPAPAGPVHLDRYWGISPFSMPRTKDNCRLAFDTAMDGVTTLIDMERAVARLNEDCVIRVYNLLTGNGFTKPLRGDPVPKVRVVDIADDNNANKLSRAQMEFITPFARACGAFVDTQAKENPNDPGAEWVVCSELVIVRANMGGTLRTNLRSDPSSDSSFPLTSRPYPAKQALKLWSRFVDVLWELTQAPWFLNFEFGTPQDPRIDEKGIGWDGVRLTEPLYDAVLAFLDIQYLNQTRDDAAIETGEPLLFADSQPYFGKKMRRVNDFTRWSRVLQRDKRSTEKPLGDQTRPADVTGVWGAGKSDALLKNQIAEEIGVTINGDPDTFKELVNKLQIIDGRENDVIQYTQPGSGVFPPGTVINRIPTDTSTMPGYYYLDTLIWPQLLAPIQSQYLQMREPSGGADPTSIALKRTVTDDIAKEIGLLETRKVTSTYMYGNVKYVRSDDAAGVPGDVPADLVHTLLRRWGAVGRIIYQLHEAEAANEDMTTFEADEDDVKILTNQAPTYPNSRYKTIASAIPSLEEDPSWGAWE